LHDSANAGEFFGQLQQDWVIHPIIDTVMLTKFCAANEQYFPSGGAVV
jgi:hypothetical protein